MINKNDDRGWKVEDGADASRFDRARVMLAGMAAESVESRRITGGSVTEAAAGWVAPYYLLALQEQMASNPDGPEHFKLMRLAAGDVVALQRGGIWAARLQLERERLELDRQKLRQKTKRAAEKRRDPKRPLTDAELKACVDKVDEIMGLKRT